jgi:phage-related protein
VIVSFFRSANGREPVADYLRTLPADRFVAITATLSDLAKNGVSGANVATRHIEGKLWELKFPLDRAFYVIVTGPELILLHAYKKQGQKAPLRELEVARKRLKDVLK